MLLIRELLKVMAMNILEYQIWNEAVILEGALDTYINILAIYPSLIPYTHTSDSFVGVLKIFIISEIKNIMWFYNN